ncbi:MAG: glycosyltransferase family 2 protein [Myxococcales bacterium]|nr:glycosyltransferase family 2 protein [Myxococcales bacterium]
MVNEDVRGLVIIPAHNEAANLPAVLGRLREVAAPEDVLVVDDGSRDGTGALLARLGQAVLCHPVRRGYACAVRTGLMAAAERGYDYAVTLDADGQHDPATIHHLVAPLRDGGADVVVGCRFCGDAGYRAPPLRRLGMRLSSRLLLQLGGQRIHDTTSGLRAIGRRAFPVLLAPAPGDLHAEALLRCLRAGLRLAEVPAAMAPRRCGRSMYGPLSALLYPARLALGLWAAR